MTDIDTSTKFTTLVDVKNDYLEGLYRAIKDRNVDETKRLANQDPEVLGGYQFLYSDRLNLEDWKFYLRTVDTDYKSMIACLVVYEKSPLAQTGISRAMDLDLGIDDEMSTSLTRKGEINTNLAGENDVNLLNTNAAKESKTSVFGTNLSGGYSPGNLLDTISSSQKAEPNLSLVKSSIATSPTITQSDILDLYNLSVDSENPHASEILDWFIQVAPPATIPIWMIPTEIHKKRLSSEDLYDLALNYADEQMKKEFTKETLETALSIVSDLLDEELEYSTDISKLSDDTKEAYKRLALAKDQNLFRILGPVNLMFELIFNLDDRCTKVGGCRMLCCMHVDDSDNETADAIIDGNVEDYIDNTDEDWFFQRCMVKGTVIANRSQAVRIPLKYGGWYGCYCDEQAARTAIRQRSSEKSEVEEGDRLFTSVLANLNTTGIYDLGEYN